MQIINNKHVVVCRNFKRFIRFFVLVCFISSCAAFWPLKGQAAIQPSENFYVTDQAHVLSEQAKEHILTINRAFEKTKEQPQLAVVTLNSLEGKDIESYAVNQFEMMKLGNRQYDNGVLVLLAVKDREIRVEVGYGLEGILPDGKVGRIIDASMNDLSLGDYSEAITNIFNQLVLAVQEEYGYEDIFEGHLTSIDEGASIHPVFMMVGFVVTFVIYLFICRILGLDAIDTLFVILSIFSNVSSSSTSDSPSPRGGGGQSGGGGASRKF